MDDDGTVRLPPLRTAAVGGAGVLVGISTGLFSKMGIAKILSGQDYAYAVVIFSLVSLFLLTAGLFSIRINQRQRTAVMVGMAAFLLMAVVGSGFIFWEEYSRPRVTFTEWFEPKELTGTGMQSPQLRLTYISNSGGSQDYAPFTDNSLSVRNGDVISLRVEGFDDLLHDYKDSKERAGNASKVDETEFRMLRTLCSRGDHQQDPVCTLILSAPVPSP